MVTGLRVAAAAQRRAEPDQQSADGSAARTGPGGGGGGGGGRTAGYHPMKDVVISVRDLTKTYHVGDVDVRALRGASLDVDAGEFVAVTGPSGSGKSTFMHILGCLDRPTSGQYFLDGKDVSRLSKDELAVDPEPEDRLRLPGLQPAVADDGARQRRAAAALQRRQQDEDGRAAPARDGSRSRSSASGKRLDHYPNQLSGGQQQRVAIARALINEPSILLADEPTGNLDTRTSVEVMDIFQRLNVERGITVVLITHEMDIAEYGTRLVRFRDGRIQIDQKIANRRDGRRRNSPRCRRPTTTRRTCRRRRPAAEHARRAWSLGEPHVDLDDAADRAEGAQPQQDAHRC